MNTLVALGTLSAFTYSMWATAFGGMATYFDSVAMIIQFVVLGRYIEMTGGARARKDVRGLMELQPKRAWVRVADGSLEEHARVAGQAGRDDRRQARRARPARRRSARRLGARRRIAAHRRVG